jgi:hypothetical protein
MAAAMSEKMVAGPAEFFSGNGSDSRPHVVVQGIDQANDICDDAFG